MDFNLERCSPNGTDPYKPKCPEIDAARQAPAFPEWLTVTMLCLYLLLTNILLLNLLIAMFKWVPDVAVCVRGPSLSHPTVFLENLGT